MNGMFEFVASRGEIELTFTVDKSKLTDAMIERLVERGIMEDIRNSWASIKKDDPNVVKLSQYAGQKWIDRVHAGDLPSGGAGGPRLSPFQRALRTVVASWLTKKHGMDKGEAAKAARQPHAIVAHYAKIAADATGKDAKALIESAMATFTTAAQAIVDASAPEETEI